MKKYIFFLSAILFITGPLLMAQIETVLIAPVEPDANFGITDHEISRTGAAGCDIGDDDAPLFVMVWDGETPGFGWDYDHGDLTGYQEFMAVDEDVNHPDVVVYHNDYNNQTLAYIVFEFDEIIWYEIWEYDMGANQWDIYDGPEEIGYGIQPNVDRTPEEDLAIVWGDPNKDHIYGATGNIVGDFYSNGVVFTCGAGHDVAKPDVAINWHQNEPHILVVYRSIDYATSIENAAVLHYPYDDFTNAGANGAGALPYGDIGSFSPPRIAAPLDGSTGDRDCQVVQVEHTALGEYIVHGGNSYGLKAPQYWSSDTLNAHEYFSELDLNCCYNPQDYETRGAVVSYSEDIHVAWAYSAPDADDYFVIVNRTLLRDGKVKETYYPNYDYSYSVVNRSVFDEVNNTLPAIASRFNDDTKFIGWFNENDWHDPHPSYKITSWNEIYYDISVDADAGLVYPNPVFDQLYYDLTDKEAGMLTLYSYDGRKVLSHHVSNESGSIDVSSLPAGMYIVEVKLPNRIIRKKIVKI